MIGWKSLELLLLTAEEKVPPCSSVIVVWWHSASQVCGFAADYTDQLVKKLPTFWWTQRFITAFTRGHNLFLFWAMPPNQLPQDPSYYNPPIYGWVFQVVCIPCMHLSSPLYLLNAPPISFFSIWSPEYLVRRTDHKAPNFIVHSTPLLPRPS